LPQFIDIFEVASGTYCNMMIWWRKSLALPITLAAHLLNLGRLKQHSPIPFSCQSARWGMTEGHVHRRESIESDQLAACFFVVQATDSPGTSTQHCIPVEDALRQIVSIFLSVGSHQVLRWLVPKCHYW
jgi:hypothetical protein